MAFFRTLYAAKLADIAVMDERVSLGLQKLEQGAKVPPPPRRDAAGWRVTSHCTALGLFIAGPCGDLFAWCVNCLLFYSGYLPGTPLHHGTRVTAHVRP